MSLGGSPENRDPQTCCPGWDIRIFELASENLLAGWELWEFCKLETQSRRGRRVFSETLPLRSPRLCVSKFPSINTPFMGRAIALPQRGLRC